MSSSASKIQEFTSGFGRGAGARDTALEEQKRSFLRMVSHELRTPLNSIIGFSEILADELYGPLGQPQYRDYAEHVRASGLKLLRLVNQVLEIARLEGGVSDLMLMPESLDNVIDDILHGLAPDAEARGIKIIVENRGDLPSVMADHRGLRTAPGNLIQNALTFSPEGGEVRLGARRLPGRVQIEICDQGEGVAAEDIPRLLRPFEQGGNTLTRSTEGAGLGLPIADLFCQAMGGTLRLASEQGRGLTATICLPAA